MKLFTAFVLLTSMWTSAHAAGICVKNDGLFVAYVRSELWDNTSKRFFYETKLDLLIHQQWCSNAFKPEKGDYINIKVTHFTGGETLETCNYEKIKENRIIVANGTTYNYWCHDSASW